MFAMRIKPLVLVTLVLLHVEFIKSQCPSTVTACTCQTVSGQSRKNIRCQGLTQIPVFDFSPELFQKLDMDSPTNYITVVQANAFNGIKVEEIDMSGQNIKLQSIHQMAFAGLEQHLTIVKLQGDEVLPPPFEQMKNIINLQELQLQYFSLPVIEESTKFNYFPYLKTLRLRNMKTSFVSSESFKNQLQELTLFEFANNHVPTFPKPVINRLRKLQHLSWLHNGMTTISYSSFDSLSSLTELDLRGNDIGEMSNGSFIGIIDKLQFLSLQLNRLSKESIVPLGNHIWPELEQLNLGHMMSEFTDIPNGLFRSMPKLANLIIPGNKLKVIKTNDFQGLGNMHALDLSENWINTVQKGALSPKTRLDTLDLRSQYDSNVNNPLNFSLDALKGAELALKTLHIQENHLIDQYAWEAIGAMKNLANLDISGTGLSDIPSLLFYSHSKLGSLTMRNNNITYLRQETLYGLKNSLEVIDISDNQIYTIDECVFEDFNKLKYFFASKNSFVCDCNLYGLYQFLKLIPSPGLAILTCKSPANLAEQTLLNLETGQFCSNLPNFANCPDLTTTSTTTSTIGTTLVVTTTSVSNSTMESITDYTTSVISNLTIGITPFLTTNTTSNSTIETNPVVTTTSISNSTIGTNQVLTTTAISNLTIGTTPIGTTNTTFKSTNGTSSVIKTNTTSNLSIGTTPFLTSTISNSTIGTTPVLTTTSASNSTTGSTQVLETTTTSNSTNRATTDLTTTSISNSTIETTTDYTTTAISNPTIGTTPFLTTNTKSNSTNGTTPVLPTNTITNTSIGTTQVLTTNTISNSTIGTAQILTTTSISNSTIKTTTYLTTTAISNSSIGTTPFLTANTTSNSTIGTNPVVTTTSISNSTNGTNQVFTTTAISNSTTGPTPVLTTKTASNSTTPVLITNTTSNSTIGTAQILTTTSISNSTFETTTDYTSVISNSTIGTTPFLKTNTTSNSTIGTTSMVSLPDVRFEISNETTSSILITWTVNGDLTSLKNFLVQYKQLGINNSEKKSFPLEKIMRDHPITGLYPGSRYEICFFLELTESSKQILISCLTGTTKSVETEVTTTIPISGSDKPVGIVGGLLRSVLFIAVIAVL